MTARINWRRPGLLASSLAVLLAAAGCTSSAPNVPALETRSGAPLDTGQYPNLNIPRPVAAAQFSNEERDAKIASLKAAGARRSRPGLTASSQSQAELARLAKNNGADVLKRIESK